MNPALLAILGLSLIAAIGTAGIVALEVLRPEGVNTNATYTIIGITAPTMAVLLSWLKSVTNGQQIEAKGEEIKQQVAQVDRKADQAAKNAEVAAETASSLARGNGKR